MAIAAELREGLWLSVGAHLQTVNLKVRSIHHRLESGVRARIFVYTLANYVEWHMRAAWRQLIFADEDQAAKATRDQVAPAQRPAAAENKVHSGRLGDGTPDHSSHTFLELATTVHHMPRVRRRIANARVRHDAGAAACIASEIVHHAALPTLEPIAGSGENHHHYRGARQVRSRRRNCRSL